MKSSGSIGNDLHFLYEVKVVDKTTFTIKYMHTGFIQKTENIRPKSKEELKELYAKYFTPEGVEKFIKEFSGLDSVPEYETVVNIQ